MNRLTRQISLVLISSSLVLHGCHRAVPRKAVQRQEDKPWEEGVPPPEKEPQQEPQQEPQPGSAAGTSGHVGHTGIHYYPHSRPIFVPVPIGGRSGTMASQGPTTGSTASRAPMAGAASSGLSGRSAVGGSARGGFGGVAHGIAGS